MKAAAYFQQYAEESLNQHMSELSLEYQSKSVDKYAKLQAFKAHRHVYNNELSKKMTSLLNQDDNPWLMAELEEIKRTFIGCFAIDKLYSIPAFTGIYRQ